MTLTFTIGAGVLVGTSEGASSALMFATIGCDVAWGIIDGALLVLQRMFDRRRLARLGRAIATTPDDSHALAIVAEELDETLGPISSEGRRFRTDYSSGSFGQVPHPGCAEDLLGDKG